MGSKFRCCLIVFLAFIQLSEATVKCFKGFSGDGRPFKQRLCQTEFCIKTTEASGGSTYGCDDFTPFCSSEECVTTAQKKEVCCCKTELCNSSNHNLPIYLFITLAILSFFLILRN